MSHFTALSRFDSSYGNKRRIVLVKEMHDDYPATC